MSKKIKMSFKQNYTNLFRPALDPFGGRGKQGGLTHGGQYSVDYVVAEGSQKKNKAKITPFLKDTPPVRTPLPTKQEKARMRNASGNSFKNIVSGKEKEEIREYLKGFTCFTQAKEGYPDPCNGMHAKWQVSQGNCEGANDALESLQRCAAGFYGDLQTNLKACTNQQINLSGLGSALDKNRKGKYLKEMAAKYYSELKANQEQCELNRVEGGAYTYGCMQEEADNFNPQANREDGSCKFSQESQDVDGTFDENQGMIDGAIAPFLDGSEGGSQYDSSPYGTMPIMPAVQPRQAGFSMNPLFVIGAIAIAGLVMFMANRRPAPQTVQTV
jgi:hypothetical protein